MTPSELSDRKFYVLFVLWGLLLVLFLWSLSPILGPFILFLALVYLLAPFYGTPLYGRLVTVLAVLTGIWLIHAAGSILAPFVLALVLSYILNPVVNRVQREGLNRTLATATVLVTFLLLLVFAGILLGPLLVEQVANFVSRLPELLTTAVAWLQAQLDRLSRVSLPGMGRTEVGEILNIDEDSLEEFITSRREEIGRGLVSGLLGIGRGLGLAATIVFYLLVTSVVTFFLLRDFDKLVRNAARLVPVHRRARAYAFFRAYDELLGKFLRSQLLVCLLVGAVIGVGFWIVGFPYALLLGVAAGVFNIVPYLGFWITIGPAILIALVSGNVAVGLLKVALVFGVEQALESWFSPRIVGGSVGLHPVWVMLAIVVFGFFFGFIGLLIAVPIAVLIKLLISDLIDAYEASGYYRGPEPEVEEGGAVLSTPVGAREA